MIRFTNTVLIERPLPEVFAYVSDLEHTPDWNWAVSETRKTSSGPVGVGTRYEQTRSVPRTARESLEVAAFVRDARFEVEGVLASLPTHLIYEFRRAASGTSLRNTVEIRPRGVLRLLGPVAAARVERAVADNLAVLKARLEAGSLGS